MNSVDKTTAGLRGLSPSMKEILLKENAIKWNFLFQ